MTFSRWQNVVATYLGVALYIVLYGGYAAYERFGCKVERHFVPLLEVDLDKDAVWESGEGAKVRQRDALERKAQEMNNRRSWWKIMVFRIARHIY